MKALLVATLTSTLMPILSYGATSVSCHSIFAESLSYQLPSEFATRSAIKEEFLAEGSMIYKSYVRQMENVATPVAEAMQLPLQIRGLQEMALKSGGTMNGWKVTELPDIYSTQHGLYDFSNFTNVLGNKKIVLLEKGADVVLLNVATIGADVKNVEIITIKNANSKQKQIYVFGMKDLEAFNRPAPKMGDNMTPAEIQAQFDAYYKTILRGYGSPEGARMANQTLADLMGQKPLNLGLKEISQWDAFNKSFLAIAPKMGFRETLNGLSALHKEQQKIRNKKTSNFIYDDRGSIKTVQKIELPTGETVTAKEGSELLSINAYGDIRFVIDVPRAEDNSLRIWTWSGRDSIKPEFYIFPLNQKAANIGTQALSTDNYLPITYRRLLDVEMELQNYNSTLKHSE